MKFEYGKWYVSFYFSEAFALTFHYEKIKEFWLFGYEHLYFDGLHARSVGLGPFIVSVAS